LNHCYFTNQRGQRILKKEGKDYLNAVKLLTQREVKTPYPSLSLLEIHLYFADNRVRDADNTLKLLLDGLKGCLVEDDNWQRIPRVNIRSELDRDNGRVEIMWQVAPPQDGF